MDELRPLPEELRAQLALEAGGWDQNLERVATRAYNARTPAEMLAGERGVHEVMRRRADGVFGTILEYVAREPERTEIARKEVRRLAGEAGVKLESHGARMTRVRLLGGTVRRFRSLLLLPATPSDPALRKLPGKHGPAGAGVYPVLAMLGVTDQATPALLAAVGREVVAANSITAAREAMKQRELAIQHKTALRLTYALGDLALRARDQLRASSPPPGAPLPLAGKRVVVSLDGGRLRIKDGTARPDGDRSYNAPWREPKLLSIYAVNDAGKRDKAVQTQIDGTMGDADDVVALLIGHLRRLGAHEAAQVTFIADGGPWIWARASQIRDAVGIPPSRWVERLDYFHAVEYLGKLAALAHSLTESERKAWVADMKSSLCEGDAAELIVGIRLLGEAHDIDTSAGQAFFRQHASRIGYMASKLGGSPIGSGGMESAVRRVVNLRMKGNSIYWLEEHAEVVLHMRAHLMAGRWDQMVLDAISAPRWPARTAA